MCNLDTRLALLHGCTRGGRARRCVCACASFGAYWQLPLTDRFGPTWIAEAAEVLQREIFRPTNVALQPPYRGYKEECEAFVL